jgi:hypothetical protein
MYGIWDCPGLNGKPIIVLRALLFMIISISSSV